MFEVAMPDNPCVSCGACCARYRVSFYWAEACENEPERVPVALTEDVTPFLRCMAGTNCSKPRCVALLGSVENAVACSIYDQRPSPCREFGIVWENGVAHFESDALLRC